MKRRNGYLTRRVAVAVQVLDDLTDQVLSGSAVQVRAVGLPARPIRKSDGYFVFTTDHGPIRQIAVESLFYKTEVVALEPGTLLPGHPVLKVRLKPNRRYTAAEPITGLEGRAEPGAEIRVIDLSHPQPLKLLYDYVPRGREAAREIKLFDPEKKDLSGRMLAMLHKEQKEPEVFQVLETADREQGLCYLRRPLGRAYKKAGATVVPVHAARADERGEYFLFLPGLAEGRPGRCLVQAIGEKAVRIERDLTPGKINRLDLAPPREKGAD